MTCRHQPGDPNCGSHPSNVAAREREYAAARTPDKDRYEIEDVVRVGTHLVMKVKYPNCSRCAYEGNKVMVFLNVTEASVLKWREIDPHFRDPKLQPTKGQAPSPAARFPASAEGWDDALEYARHKSKS